MWINSKGLEDWKIRFSKGSVHNAHQSYLQYMILKEKELLEQELYDWGVLVCDGMASTFWKETYLQNLHTVWFFDWVDEPGHVLRCEGDEDAVDA